MRKIYWDNNVAGAFLLLGGGVAGHAMLETARDTLFLKALPSSALPWAYLAVAVVSGAIVLTVARLQHRLNTRKLISASYFGIAFVMLGFFALFNAPAAASVIAFALYVWVGVYITFLISSIWLVISALFSIDQAKRVFGIISAGASVGAIAGSAAAVAITSQLQRTDIVLLAAAGVFALTGLVPFFFRLNPIAAGKQSIKNIQFLAELRDNEYLRSIAGLALFSTVAVTALDWLFKTTVAAAIPADQLGSFFARFYLVANTAALLTQILLLRVLFRLLGATGTLLIFSGIVLIGSAFILSAVSFYAIIALKLAEAAFKNSLHKPAIELLYVPLHDHVRNKFKLALDLIALRGGQALASAAIILGAAWFDHDLVATAIIVFGSVVSLVILSQLKPKYVKLFRDYLREGRIGTSIDRPKLDLLSIETILDTLNSDNDAEVVAALELLEAEGKASIIPGLILFHPSERVVMTALEIFSAHPRPELKTVALRLMKDPRDRVRVGTLRLLMHFDPPEPFLRAIAQGPDQTLKATALIEMVILGQTAESACGELVTQLIADRNSQGLIDLCDAIAFWRDPRFNRELADIYAVDDLRVKRAALMALAEAPSADSLEVAEHAYRTLGVRMEAERLIVACGLPGFEMLISTLNSARYGHDVRIAIPTTLGRFDFPEVQARLLNVLVETSDGAIAYKLLRVLGRKRRLAPDAPLQLQLIDRLLDDELRRLSEYLKVAHEFAPTRGVADNTIFEMLFDLIVDRAQESLERLFRLFDLRYTDGDFEQMYYALTAGEQRAYAHAQELLIHTVNVSQARKVVQSIASLAELRHESKPAQYPARDEATGATGFVRSHLPTFRRLLQDESATVRALTAYFVGSTGTVELSADIRAAAHSDSKAINETFANAIQMLERTQGVAVES